MPGRLWMASSTRAPDVIKCEKNKNNSRPTSFRPIHKEAVAAGVAFAKEILAQNQSVKSTITHCHIFLCFVLSPPQQPPLFSLFSTTLPEVFS